MASQRVRVAVCGLTLFSALPLSTPSRAEFVCADGTSAVADLFVESDCSDCDAARYLLWHHGIPFLEHNIENERAREQLYQRLGKGTIPALHVCERWLVGAAATEDSSLLSLFVRRVNNMFRAGAS